MSARPSRAGTMQGLEGFVEHVDNALHGAHGPTPWLAAKPKPRQARSRLPCAALGLQGRLVNVLKHEVRRGGGHTPSLLIWKPLKGWVRGCDKPARASAHARCVVNGNGGAGGRERCGVCCVAAACCGGIQETRSSWTPQRKSAGTLHQQAAACGFWWLMARSSTLPVWLGAHVAVLLQPTRRHGPHWDHVMPCRRHASLLALWNNQHAGPHRALLPAFVPPHRFDTAQQTAARRVSQRLNPQAQREHISRRAAQCRPPGSPGPQLPCTPPACCNDRRQAHSPAAPLD